MLFTITFFIITENNTKCVLMKLEVILLISTSRFDFIRGHSEFTRILKRLKNIGCALLCFPVFIMELNINVFFGYLNLGT